MKLRMVFLPSTLAGLLALPAAGSQPGEFAGKMITNPPVGCSIPSFSWDVGFGNVYQLDPSDTVTLDMALIPFRTGETFFTLSGIEGSYFHLIFRDGLVDGIRYDTVGWNDVLVTLRPASQDYLVTVNGQQAGPFPYPQCRQPGGCFTLSDFHVGGYANDPESTGWIDTIEIDRTSAAGMENFFRRDFDNCEPPRPYSGAVLIEDVPKSAGPATCSSAPRTRF